ncbi:MAG: phospho-N-acetylmuramoyl-pentapeptide-transferase [Planctomycetota bacterium]
MLYYLFELRDAIPGFNLFRYITTRAVGAGLTAFLIAILLGPRFVALMRRFQVRERVNRPDAPELSRLHASKADTPTMGGILILLAVLLAALLWSDLGAPLVWMAILVMATLGLVGFLDDYIKLTRPRGRGLRIKTKILWQIGIGLVASYLLAYHTVAFLLPVGTREIHAMSGTAILLPFTKVPAVLGVFYLAWVTLVVVGTSNAVNLTDGLDGLASGCVVMAGLGLAVIGYIVGRSDFSRYLLVPHVPGAGELAVVATAIVGGTLGFLWYNCFPAEVFMGDVGALSLGGGLGFIAAACRQELVLIILGGVFVAEALSVVLQVASFRLTGKRIFRIAPLHHHFQYLGWPESKVTIRFWIVSALLAIVSVITLKIR